MAPTVKSKPARSYFSWAVLATIIALVGTAITFVESRLVSGALLPNRSQVSLFLTKSICSPCPSAPLRHMGMILRKFLITF